MNKIRSFFSNLSNFWYQLLLFNVFLMITFTMAGHIIALIQALVTEGGILSLNNNPAPVYIIIMLGISYLGSFILFLFLTYVAYCEIRMRWK